MESVVGYELVGDIAHIQFDDGKANVITPQSLAALVQAFERAEHESRCVLWTGRPGRFCAGFDLGVISAGGAPAVDLLNSGAELAARLYSFEVPVLIGCSGHAMGMGAIYLLAADVRLAARGAFKIGLPEVALGMTMPAFGIELTQERLAPTHLTRAVACAEIFDPDGALAAGFVDRLVDPEQLHEQSLAMAAALAGLNSVAHRETKAALRRESLQRLRAGLGEFSIQGD